MWMSAGEINECRCQQKQIKSVDVIRNKRLVLMSAVERISNDGWRCQQKLDTSVDVSRS